MKSNKVFSYGNSSILIYSNDIKWLVKYSNQSILDDIIDKISDNNDLFIEKWKTFIADFGSIRICKNKKNRVYQLYFLIQLVYYKLLDYSSIPIHISTPLVKKFSFKEPYISFQYQIEKIHPVGKQLYFIDMRNPDRNEYIKLKGLYCGYNVLESLGVLKKIPKIDNKFKLIAEIGLLYSYLHFVLQVDGYKCKLVVGCIDNKTEIFILNFDKTTCYDFESQKYPIFRKLTHNKTIPFNNTNNLLYSSLKDNILIPNNRILDMNLFLDKYKTFVNFKDKNHLNHYNYVYNKFKIKEI